MKQLDSLIYSVIDSSLNHFDKFSDYANLIHRIQCRFHRKLLMQWLMGFRMLKNDKTSSFVNYITSHQCHQTRVV